MESHVSVSSNQENGNPANKEHYPVIDEVGEPLTVGYNVKQKDLSPKKPVSKKLYCHQCEYVTERKSRLGNHKVSTHENNGYGCEYCDFRSGGKCEVESHKRQAHPELKEIKMLKKISCDEWDWIAKTHDGRPRPEKLLVHKRIAHGEKFPCNLCEKVFLKEEKLTIYKNYQHDVLIHACDDCYYKTKIKWSLMSHCRIHHRDQMFFCDQCDFSGKRIGQVNRHIQVKHEGKRYYCEECEYIAPYKGGLSRHMDMMHKGVTFSCDFCEHKSSTKGNLKLHTDAKQLGIKFICDQCEFRGSQPGTLKIHKQSKHSSPIA